MKIYLAGNFPQLSNPEEEKQMIQEIRKQGSAYKRLVSFYYNKETMTVLNLKMEEIANGKESKEISDEEGAVAGRTCNGEESGSGNRPYGGNGTLDFGNVQMGVVNRFSKSRNSIQAESTGSQKSNEGGSGFKRFPYKART